MTDILTPLTADERTVLDLAAQGQSMMPVGRWEIPVLTLARKGLLLKEDQFNYTITDEGKLVNRGYEAAQDLEIETAMRKFIAGNSPAGDDNA